MWAKGANPPFSSVIASHCLLSLRAYSPFTACKAKHREIRQDELKRLVFAKFQGESWQD